ncbi:MAG: amidohydrolase family protein [Haloquadratum sp.]|nr:amidohydrolase family protein [Haloferacaceae archaeon]MDR9445769.1 amidohydrolase family protein [Haloquadratum sp.]
MELEGTVLWGRDLTAIEGRLHIAAGRIVDFEQTPVDGADIIMPAFVNGHTHLGDSIAKEAGAGVPLKELVAPPDGLKHQLLRAASPETIIRAIRGSLQLMIDSGTTATIEFREGGVAGVERLLAAQAGLPIELQVMARPSEAALARADGFGASSVRDEAYAEVRAAAAAAGKPFGIHAGERDPDDIDGALALEPDFLVHMGHAEPAHLRAVAEAEIPIVVCPRSNLVTGVGMPPIGELHAATTVALGTDNVMMNAPSMLRELEFAAKLTDLDARTLLQMATVHPAAIGGFDAGVLEVGAAARLVVFDGASPNLRYSKDIHRAIVRRATAADITQTFTAMQGEGFEPTDSYESGS